MKKILFFLTLSVLFSSCIGESQELKKSEMIKPSIFNAINFSSDFNRESDQFDPFLQRRKNIISSLSSCCLVFEYTPDTMPASAPDATITATASNGSTGTATNTNAILLDSSIIYYFYISELGLIPYDFTFYVTILGSDCILYSEECTAMSGDELADNNIISITAYNDDNTHGYITETYKACGFFKVSELNGNVFGNEKVEYEYSYGRKKILSSENFIKKRYTFVDLTMYQRNLLKALCNCENLTINGTLYSIVSDFTDIGKDENNEIYSLQADFLPVGQSFFAIGASEAPSKLTPENLFMN